MYRLIAILILGTVIPFVASAAAVFSDVPDGHLYKKEIESLASARVINGNPDGTFAPERTVNRAELLAMLYRATGRTPDPANTKCFPDVAAGSWYEPTVCDAAAHRFVAGYPDGTFRPSAAVNRVEALKMILGMFDIQPGRYGVEERDIIKFVDVSTSAWYSGYLYTAFTKGVLPIAGQDGSRFYPEWPLLRGEAAAYIYNALHRQLQEDRSESSSSSDTPSSAAAAPSTASSVSGDNRAVSQTVNFPFSVSGKTVEKKPFSYTFSLVNPLTASTTVKLTASTGKISCRLYLLGENGFSTRYFLGYQEGTACYLLTALDAGNYQLQVQSSVANASYTAEMKAATGDGNDGFSQAKRLLPQVSKTVTLGENNIVDFYTFSVSTEQSMKVELSNSTNLTCIVYPMEDVDLASFTGPECNQNYVYSKGTYSVAVQRNSTKGAKLTYTILLR